MSQIVGIDFDAPIVRYSLFGLAAYVIWKYVLPTPAISTVQQQKSSAADYQTRLDKKELAETHQNNKPGATATSYSLESRPDLLFHEKRTNYVLLNE